jgi:ketosteroid isomerase-like protein
VKPWTNIEARMTSPGDNNTDATRRTVYLLFEKLQTGAAPEAIAALFGEDIDWHIAGDVDLVPWIGRREGRDGVAAFFRDLRQRVEPLRFEVRTTVAEGEKAVALGELESRVKSTGNIIETEFAIEFTVRNGLIVRYRLFEDSFAVARAVA